MVREDDNAAFTREVGNVATRAIQAFADEQYHETVLDPKHSQHRPSLRR